jgi:hypothetical protein
VGDTVQAAIDQVETAPDEEAHHVVAAETAVAVEATEMVALVVQ